MDFDETEGRNRSIILDRSVEVELEHAKRRTRMGMKSIGGEILQVHGGHIVRSTARKDRHSKVYTAKGPRDRRVRLSAHTAIQFYDVQDRLGYDRPSKAVDWLIRKAKSAIDKLSELPGGVTATTTDPNGDEIDMVAERSESSGFNNFQFQAENLIPSPPVSAVDFRSFQNLGLSLQTLQDAAGNHEARNSPQTDQTVLYTAGSGNSTLEFDDSYERMVAWNNVLGSAPAAFPQRAPLQAAVGLPSAVVNYAWNDLSVDSAGTGQKYHPIHEHSSLSTTRYVTDELPEFDIQGRLRFEDENDVPDVVSGKASSRSSVYFRH